MDLSIIIVSWNVKDKLRDNLRALYASKGDFNFEVIVIDNNSEDGSVAMVKDDFPQAELIVNIRNEGFAKACNQGIKDAKGDYILLLNPDMRVKEDTLFNMIKWFDDNPRVSVSGCKLISETGEIIKHVRRFPTIWDQSAVVLKIPHIYQGILKKYLCDDFNYDWAEKVDSIRGGFFMFRYDAIQPINFLDERFFLWFEEVDYCRRIKESGGEVWYTPTAECIDYVGQSFKQVASSKKQKYFRDSMLKYFKKWHPRWQYWVLWFLWWVGLFIAWMTEKLKIKSKART
jgi:GT2 family glycosyltransferase